MRTPALAGLAVAAAVLLAAADGPAAEAGPEAASAGRTLGAGAQVAGPALARELGCGACHTGVGSPDVIRTRAPRLGPAGDPLDAGFVFTYLADPVARRDDIGASRMPSFGLDEGERLALALFLGASGTGGDAVAGAARRHPDVTARRGAMIWGALACAGCHGPTTAGATASADPVPGRPGPDLSREGVRVRPDWLQGYLAAPGRIRSDAHPASPGARMPDFRLSAPERAALAAWLATLGRPVEAEPADLTPHQAERTDRMLEDRVACLGCHALDGTGGAVGPSLDGAAARLRPGFVAEMILDPDAAAPGSLMPHQAMPAREARRLARLVLDRSGESWAPGDYRSLADPEHPAWVTRGFMAPGAPEPDRGAGADPATAAADALPDAPASSAPADAATDGTARSNDGGALYARHCAACHGSAGQGDGWNAPNLPVPPTAHADADAMGVRPDDTLFDGIHGGAWVLDGSARMPPFGDLLTAGQIRALVAYIRTLCACTEPAWAGDGR